MAHKSEISLLAGLTSLVGAAVTGQFALRHIQSIQAVGPICGDGAEPHCAWCPATLALLALGLVLLTLSAGRRQVALRQCAGVKSD
ncbi:MULTISPECIES: hypothetical protein [Phenylobacterium]|uniref:Uncharacterized protein n=1 Tax=Phenylobacterium koreense TaxID=266125 RepID=A0ABV2EE21_9CAUL